MFDPCMLNNFQPCRGGLDTSKYCCPWCPSPDGTDWEVTEYKNASGSQGWHLVCTACGSGMCVADSRERIG